MLKSGWEETVIEADPETGKSCLLEMNEKKHVDGGWIKEARRTLMLTFEWYISP